MIKEYQLRKLQNSYEVTLNYKGVKVRVAFTGGNVYNGTMPKFRTNDAFKMKAVESSELFKNREVVVARTIQEKVETAQPVVQQRKKAVGKVVMPAPKPAPAPTPAPVAEDPEPPVSEPDAPEGKEPENEPAGEEGVKDVTFDNLGEAIIYIAQNWNIQVQTEKDAREVLKQHNLNPHIKKG